MSYVCQRSGLNPSMGATLDLLSQEGSPWAGSSTSRPMVPLQSAAEKADHPMAAVEREGVHPNAVFRSTHPSHPSHPSHSAHPSQTLAAHDPEIHFLKLKSPEAVAAQAANFQNNNWNEIRSVVPQGTCGTAVAERYPMDRRGYVTYAATFPSPISNQCHADQAVASYWFPPKWKQEGAPQYLPGYSGFLRGPFGGANL